jgi:hypothetical protein
MAFGFTAGVFAGAIVFAAFMGALTGLEGFEGTEEVLRLTVFAFVFTDAFGPLAAVPETAGFRVPALFAAFFGTAAVFIDFFMALPAGFFLEGAAGIIFFCFPVLFFTIQSPLKIDQ